MRTSCHDTNIMSIEYLSSSSRVVTCRVLPVAHTNVSAGAHHHRPRTTGAHQHYLFHRGFISLEVSSSLYYIVNVFGIWVRVRGNRVGTYEFRYSREKKNNELVDTFVFLVKTNELALLDLYSSLSWASIRT